MSAVLYWYLSIAFAICSAGSYLSYSNLRLLDGTKYALAALAGLAGYFWALAVRNLNTAEKVYVYSLYWDGVVLGAYYLLPIFVMGVRPTVGVVAGSLLVVLGFVVIKAWG